MAVPTSLKMMQERPERYRRAETQEHMKQILYDLID